MQNEIKQDYQNGGADTTYTDSAAQSPIIPVSYDYAVRNFDMDAPTQNQESYLKQVDIYSDQIIAIEAIRLEVLQLTQRIILVEHDMQEK